MVVASSMLELRNDEVEYPLEVLWSFNNELPVWEGQPDEFQTDCLSDSDDESPVFDGSHSCVGSDGSPHLGVVISMLGSGFPPNRDGGIGRLASSYVCLVRGSAIG